MRDYSKHARVRMQQRTASEEQVEAVVRWGIEIRQRNGRVAYYLGDRQVKAAQSAGEQLWACRGTAVVLGRDAGVITVLKALSPTRLRRHSK